MKKEFMILLKKFFDYIDEQNRILYSQHRSLEERNGVKFGTLDREKSLEEFYIWLEKHAEDL